MTTLKLILHELWGLFVDDDRLAVAILAVVFVACVLAFGVHAAPEIIGSVIALGCLMVLIESTIRGGRKY